MLNGTNTSVLTYKERSYHASPRSINNEYKLLQPEFELHFNSFFHAVRQTLHLQKCLDIKII